MPAPHESRIRRGVAPLLFLPRPALGTLWNDIPGIRRWLSWVGRVNDAFLTWWHGYVSPRKRVDTAYSRRIRQTRIRHHD